jgi:hypothetical protein
MSTDRRDEDLEQKNMAIVRQAHADLEAGDVAGFKAAIAPDYTRHCQAMPPDLQELHGTEQFFAFIDEFRAQPRITSHFGTPIHPAWLRCSELKYLDILHSSRLASRAPRRPKKGSYFWLHP